jgi:spore germination protein YaaH
MEANRSRLDAVSPWSYEVLPDGSITLQHQLDPVAERAAVDRARRAGMQIVPSVANTTDGLWNEQTIAAILADEELRRNHVAELVELAVAENLHGLQIDYENLRQKDQSGFSAFVTELGPALHDADKQLFVTVHVKETDAGYDERNAAQDYAAIGAVADRVTLMAYDWHWESSEPGAIAPYSWVDRVVQYAVDRIPSQKLLLGIGLFGYDWPESGPARNLTWVQIAELAGQVGAGESWDVGTQSPWLSYRATDGTTRTVWYENARSVQYKYDVARRYELGGIAWWRLGGEDPSIWSLPAADR